jgi:Cofilin/tropomyosin-type actin-binding protein
LITGFCFCIELEETSGTRNKIIEGAIEGRQERGFMAGSTVKRTEKLEPRSIAPAGLEVKAAAEVGATIAEVRDDVTPTNWVVVGFENNGDIKKPLVVVAKGNGDVDEMKQHFDDGQAMYALFRTTDVYDDIKTVKFVFIYWLVTLFVYHYQSVGLLERNVHRQTIIHSH